MRFRFLFACLFITAALPVTSAHAQPTYKSLAPADFKVPAANLEKWANRLKMLCPEKGWTVKVEGNDVFIICDKPVTFISSSPKELPSYEGVYRLKLSFAPLLTQDEFEALEVKNDQTFLQDYELLKKYQIRLFMQYPLSISNSQATKYSVYSFSNDGAVDRAAYIEASKKLTYYNYPDFYSPDYSITFTPASTSSFSAASGDKKIDEECQQVEKAVRDQFGKYFRSMKRYSLPSVPMRSRWGSSEIPNWPDVPPIMTFNRNRTPKALENPNP